MHIKCVEPAEVYECQTSDESSVYIVRLATLHAENWEHTYQTWICQCEGFKWRQKCKHLDAVKESLI